MRSGNKDGFTIIEPIIATIVILTGVVGVLTLVVAVNSSMMRPEDHEVALLIQKKQQELLVDEKFSASLGFVPSLSLGTHGPEAATVEGRVYTINYVVNPVTVFDLDAPLNPAVTRDYRLTSVSATWTR